MKENYYCNGKWFNSYTQACAYAFKLLTDEHKYYAVFTKAEMDSITNAIDHEMECGK